MDLTVKKPTAVSGTLQVSGDKSISHRALLIGAIAKGVTEIRNHSQGNDCRSTLECLRHLGIAIEEDDDRIRIMGQGIRGFHEPSDVLDCGNSGTTMRLLAGLLCGQNFNTMLTGDRSLKKRPMMRVIDPLTRMNALIQSRSVGFAPLSIQGRTLKAIDYTIPVASAQVKSALIFAGMLAHGVTTIREPVKTRDHTERMLAAFNAGLRYEGNSITVMPEPGMTGQQVCVPGDISSAAFFIVMASILPGSDLLIQHVGVNPTRTGMIDVLRSMGGAITYDDLHEENNEPVTDIRVVYSPLGGLDVDGDIIPRLIDELPVIAVAATQAKGVTRISNAGELRLKETDRIYAIVKGLQSMGALIHEHKDGFVIHGPCILHGAICSSYQDHRIAMALTIAGLIATGETVIQNAECIAISFPEFITRVKEVCGEDTICISE